jgi:hypothetical protein
MGMIDQFLPKEIKDILNKIFADEAACKDLDIVLSAVGPLFDRAGKDPATNASLKGTFNDVASVLPVFANSMKKRKLAISVFDMPKVGGTMMRLGKPESEPKLKEIFNGNGPEITKINASLLQNDNVQFALERILKKPLGQELFLIEKKDGKCVAIEQKLSGIGIKIPLREDIYDRIKNIGGGNTPPPAGPSA